MRGWPRRSRGATDPPPSVDYDAVYRRSVDGVYRVCLAILRDPDAAEDATMDVFKKLLASPPGRVDDGLDGWLRATARTTAIDHLRALRRHLPLDDALDLSDPAPTPEEVVLAGDRVRSLDDLLGVLTPAQRQVIELRRAGLSGKEIAQVLGQTRNWVDQTAYRALQRLQREAGAAPAGPARKEAAR